MFNLTEYKNHINSKIINLQTSLKQYREYSNPHHQYMAALIQEEINTLKWVLQLTNKYQKAQETTH